MFIISADLGQTTDYTAITLIEQATKFRRYAQVVEGTEASQFNTELSKATYRVRGLKRMRQVSYVDVVEDIVNILSNGRITADGYRMVIDQGGVGAAVGDLLEHRKVANLVRVHVTSGAKPNFNNGIYNVPKKDLVGAGTMVLQTGRLQICQDLELAPRLKKELLEFKMKITKTGATSYEAATEDIHDDMVMSLLQGIWVGENDFIEEEVIDRHIEWGSNDRDRASDWDVLTWDME